MMLPASIEAHLKEVGFSQTELLILRHSLGGKPQSLRELAILTGKSTGVLDQAMKKLLQRNIFKKETINNSVRFVLTSLEAIVQWVEEDVQKKTKSLIRKKDDFASFVQTIDANGSRPKVEYFDGEEGIKKAYMQLLDMGCKELMQFLPLTQKEEDNPLSEFLSKFTRSRRKRGIALRVLTHDTPLGKRFQFKDAFNNRETVLLPLSQYPIPFEKILCGNCVACFKHSEKQAFFMHFPELAEGERGVFQNYWDGEIGEGEGKEIIEEKMHIWPLKIKTFALVCIGAALFATGITYSLYKQNYYLNTERVRDHVRSIAANAVKDFSWQDIRNINDWQDAMSNEYFNVLRKLSGIKDRNPDIVYAYILRPTNSKYYYEFVVDADSMNIRDKEDHNEDGLRNDTIAPGHIWLDEYPETSAVSKALKGNISADKKPVHDPWGTWISGHAPIKDSFGNTVAILGTDMDASKVFELTIKDFAPLIYFAIIFIILLISQFAGAIIFARKT